MPASERNAVLLALGAILGWSTVATAFKLGLAVLTPIQLLFQATLVSAAIFAVANSIRGDWVLRPRTALRAVVFGSLNPIAYYLLLFAAYDRLPAQIAQAVNYTWAIVLALLAVPLLGQVLTGRTLVAVIVSYAGVLTITVGAQAHPELNVDPVGLGLALVSTVVWAAYWLLNARDEESSVAMMCWSFLFATPVLALICALTDGLPAWDHRSIPFALWVGAVEMGITFLLWSAALRRTRHAARIGQLVFLAPFLSLLMIERVLGEPVPTTSWLGLAIIVAGLLVAGPVRTR